MPCIEGTRPAPASQEPFAALPHAHTDAARTPLEKAVLLALLFFARGKAECWPSDAATARRVGRHGGTVPRALGGLEAAGVTRRRHEASGRRVIVLCWRDGGVGPARRPPAAPSRH